LRRSRIAYMPTNPLGQIACAEWDRRLRSNLQNNELARLFLNQGVVGSSPTGGAKKDIFGCLFLLSVVLRRSRIAYMPTNPLGQIACVERDRRLRSNLQNNELARLFHSQWSSDGVGLHICPQTHSGR
ncbi:MAG: hypothetical protein IKV97_02415, partial [Clostridia bacterium]|nr:hypothetical protein [Clostridia bacterium]